MKGNVKLLIQMCRWGNVVAFISQEHYFNLVLVQVGTMFCQQCDGDICWITVEDFKTTVEPLEVAI